MQKIKFGCIVCALVLIVALPACASNGFPTGLFSHLTMNQCVLKLNNNHTWTNDFYGVIVGSGTYSIQDNLFILWMNPKNNTADSNVFIYEWSYEDDILTLTLLGSDGYSEQFRHLRASPALKSINDLKTIEITQQISKFFHFLQTLVKPLTFIRLR